jgi:chromosome segregation ATPase
MNEITVLEIEQENALTIFTSNDGLDPYLERIEKEAKSLIPDVSTKKGRDQIASNAYKVRQSKTAIDKVGKALVDKLKEQPKLVDAERKRMRDFLDALAIEVRKPLDDFEKKEADRVQKIKDRLSRFSLNINEDLNSSSSVKNEIAEIEALTVDESFAEFEAEAHREKAARLAHLNALYESLSHQEAEQAELERLRKEAVEREQKEREDRIAREAEERARKEMEEAAEKQRQEAINREKELKLAAERAEREKLEAEERARKAAFEAEQRLKREEDERIAREAQEQKAREENKKHKAGVNNQILKALQQVGVTADQGKEIISMIVKGEIPNVSINY